MSFTSNEDAVRFCAKLTMSFSDFPFCPRVALVRINFGFLSASPVSLRSSMDNSIPNEPLYVCASSSTTYFQFANLSEENIE